MTGNRLKTVSKSACSPVIEAFSLKHSTRDTYGEGERGEKVGGRMEREGGREDGEREGIREEIGQKEVGRREMEGGRVGREGREGRGW